MSVGRKRAFGPLFAPKYDRPWLRYIVDGGEGVIEPTGTAPKGDESKPADPDWKAESRKWEARAKENKAAADELEKLREAQKSDEQRRAESDAERDRKLAAYELRDQVTAWSTEIAKDSHIPASALRGSTREELEAHFKELTTLIPKPTDEPAPKKGAWAPFDPDEGKSPSSKSEPASAGMGTLRAAYAQAESKGDS